jgi:hypothetical protein
MRIFAPEIMAKILLKSLTTGPINDEVQPGEEQPSWDNNADPFSNPNWGVKNID